MGTRDATSDALAMFTGAIERDRDFALAWAMAAWCHLWRKVNGWMTDPVRELTEGTRSARRAAELGKGDADALARSGHALAHLAGDIDGGTELIDRALVLNPNLAAAWYIGGHSKIWRGDLEGAIECFAHAMRLSPLDPEVFRIQGGTAMAHLLMGRLDAAVSWAEMALRELPGFVMAVSVLAASYALLEHGQTQQRSCASSLRRCVCPCSKIGSQFGDQRISRGSRTGCEKRDYQSEGRLAAGGVRGFG